jgi:hypothetical protein
MKPKYSEGEIVILQSANFPEYSGEYEVFKVLFYNDEFPDRLDKTVMIVCDGPIGYVLTEALADKLGTSEVIWAEHSLRKRQEPGQMGYKELMASLKNSVLEWN